MSGKPIDGVVQALIEVAVGKVQHLYRGTCPDAIEGFDSRDPQCPACRVLTAAQQPAAARGDVPYDRELIAQMLDAAEAPAFTMEEMDTQARLLREAAQAKPEAQGGESAELRRMVAKLAAHVRPTCGELWAEAERLLNSTAPPSAPVGVEAIAAEIRASLGRGATDSTRRRWAIELEALAQQPAAAGEEIMVNAAHDVYTLPLQPSGLSSGPRFVVHVPGPEQPAAAEGFDEWYDSVDARFWDNRDACNAAFHAGKRAALAQQPAARWDVRKLLTLAEQWERDAAGCRRDGYIDAAVVKEDCAQRIRQTLGISAIAKALARQPAAEDWARFRKAPCYLCGYNGAGYFQPETHPCAALYHAAQPGGAE